MKANTIFTAIICLVLTFGMNSCSDNKQTVEETKPNILFIMADDHAVAAISAYKDWLSEIAPTPNIDRIAKNGMLMTRTFNTNSICGPSRAAILTGKYGHESRFFKNEKGGDFDGSQQTFPKILQKNGYQTAVIGKWHLGTAPTGFDYSKVMINWGGQGTYFNPVFLENGKDTMVEKTRHSTAQVAHDAIKWLDQGRDKTKPFMLMYQFKAPHRPWEPAPEFQKLFQEDLPHPANFNDDYKGRKAASKQWMEIENHMNRKDLKVYPKEKLTPRELNTYNAFGNKGQFWTPHDSLQGAALKNWKYQTYIKDYLRCVAGVDKAVGQMLDYLKANDMLDNTVIVYTSDQGFYLGEHGWFDKRFMYEESFRMPFMISYPEMIKPGTTNDNLLLNIDFAPTLLDLAGIETPKDMQGTSFKNQLSPNIEAQGRDAIYYHYYEFPKWHNVEPHYGVRTDRYKLIHFYYSMDEWELFDLDNDKHEMNNLYGKPGYEEITAALKKRIKELQVEFKDDMSLEEMRAMTDMVVERVYSEENINKAIK